MKNKNHIQALLLSAICDQSTTPYQIREGKAQNPFPIGKRGVYEMALNKIGTAAQWWDMVEYFKLEFKT